MRKTVAIVLVGLLCLSTFSVLTLHAEASPDAVPSVVCVPFRGDPTTPHDAWIGKEITFKGTAHDADGDGTLTSHFWDFGDGYNSSWIAVTDPYALEAKHTYTGVRANGVAYGPGTLFTAWLRVNDTSLNMGEDDYFVGIMDVSTPRKLLECQVNVAIDDGLWWLHKNQVRYSSGGLDYGRWDDVGYTAGPTSTAILAFEIHGHLPSGDRSKDPYVETVQRGFNHVFAQCYATPISGPDGTCPYGNPDTNGNGLGVDISSGRPVYEMGMVMMAIAASGAPNLTAATGPANIIGRRYFDILTDMVDMCAWGQNQDGSGRGGWRYYWNYGSSDNSVTQWPIIGLEAAETEEDFGITAPSFVKPELNTWLAYSQNPGGGFGYTSPWEWVNPPKTGAGICGLAYVGLPSSDSRVVNALNYLDSQWGTSGQDGVWGNYYGLYAIMKGCRLFEPDIQYIGAHDWYWDNPGGFARYLVDQQMPGGNWPNAPWAGYVLDTGWAILTLSPTLHQRYPVAEAGADVNNHPPEPVEVEFDASGSYHTDPARNITTYVWDFGDNTSYIGPEKVVWHAYPAYKDGGIINWSKTAKDYVATLTVIDDNVLPLNDTDTRIIHITAPPWKPVADPNGPYDGVEGNPIQLDGSNSYDPEEKMYTSGHPWYENISKYEWDLDNDGQFDDSTEIKPKHTWLSNGTYAVGLKVTDSVPSGPGGEVGPLDWDAKYIMVHVRDIIDAIHDVAVVDVAPELNWLYQGQLSHAHVSVNVTNQGEVSETFDVTVYADNDTSVIGDEYLLGIQPVTDLMPAEFRQLSFTWNTNAVAPCHYYVITAVADILLNETDTADNSMSSMISVKVRLIGDVNGDGQVNMLDLWLAATAFGGYPDGPIWMHEADMNEDDLIDIRDLYAIAKNFGKICLPP